MLMCCRNTALIAVTSSCLCSTISVAVGYYVVKDGILVEGYCQDVAQRVRGVCPDNVVYVLSDD